MFKLALCLCLAASLYKETSGVSVTSAYNAKVVDYQPETGLTGLETLNENARQIIKLVDEQVNVDFLVFPEYCMTGTGIFSSNNITEYSVKLPAVDSEKNLCKGQNVDSIISFLACPLLAPLRVRYLVVNVLERDGKDLYNTNIVLDSKGTLVAKYRKINLNEEEKRYLKPGTEAVHFTTDFGVTFGLITSDDILHANPAQEVLSPRNVTDVIMTSAWQSEMPFYMSIGLQDGYAKKNGINLLAASLSEPGKSRGGSGLYTMATPVAVFVPSVPATKLKESTLAVITQKQPSHACNPKVGPRASADGESAIGQAGPATIGIGKPPTLDNFITKAISDVDGYKHKSILSDVNNFRFQEELCQGGFCCKFDVTYNEELPNLDVHYKAVVSNRACGIVACDKDENNVRSCGSRKEEVDRAEFKKIHIEVKLKSKDGQYLPVASNRKLTFIPYKYCDTSDSITITAEPANGLIYLGLIGTNSTSSAVIMNVGLGALVAIIVTVFNILG